MHTRRARDGVISEARPVHAEITGQAIRAMLGYQECAQFDAEFGTTVVRVTRTYDLGVVTSLLRQWWVRAGGDPTVAEMDREREQLITAWANRDYGPERPLYVPAHRINQTAPDVRAALPPAERTEFEREFEQALAIAAREYDIQPAREILAKWWAAAVYLANPENLTLDQETLRHLKSHETPEPATESDPEPRHGRHRR